MASKAGRPGVRLDPRLPAREPPVDGRFRPDRVVRIVEACEPDIVLPQEVDDGVPRSRRMDLGREVASSLGYPHIAIGYIVTLRKGRYGNAALSRHPILLERNITCPRASRPGSATCKLALLARSRELASLPTGLACLAGGDLNDWRSQPAPVLTGPPVEPVAPEGCRSEPEG
jgi:hypothetical protein